MCPAYLFQFLEIRQYYIFSSNKIGKYKKEKIRLTSIFCLKNMKHENGKAAVGNAMGRFRK